MTIKLHLERAEIDPVERTAKAFGCSVEDILYMALDAYMLRLGNLEAHCGPDCRKAFSNPEVMRQEVLNAKAGRRNNLPLWADSAGSAHNYESFEPEHPHKSDNSAF